MKSPDASARRSTGGVSGDSGRRHPALAAARVSMSRQSSLGLPFFIEWGDGVHLPGATAVPHPSGDVRLRRLSLSVDSARLTSWLGENDLPVSVTSGRAGVVSVVLARGEEEFGFDARAQYRREARREQRRPKIERRAVVERLEERLRRRDAGPAFALTYPRMAAQNAVEPIRLRASSRKLPPWM